MSALARSDAPARVLTGLGATPVSGELTDTEVLREAAAAADGVIHLGQHYGDGGRRRRGGAAESTGDHGMAPGERGTRAVPRRAPGARHAGPGLRPRRRAHRNALPRTGAPDRGRRHWALVHAFDIAELHALALRAPAKSVYAGVSGQNVPLADIVSVLAAGGPITRLTLAEAVARMGPIAEAFALDQQLTPARAQRELGWTPRHLDALRELRG
ncbi:hypothetical protein AB0M83_41965 [Amycolatopsis sp. NPDC051106]|uniref:hypothetical protein n=1 Tax=unclassified Amycolatopsis TaxID=2618356 RepID=UPI00344A80A0